MHGRSHNLGLQPDREVGLLHSWDFDVALGTSSAAQDQTAEGTILGVADVPAKPVWRLQAHVAAQAPVAAPGATFSHPPHVLHIVAFAEISVGRVADRSKVDVSLISVVGFEFARRHDSDANHGVVHVDVLTVPLSGKGGCILHESAAGEGSCKIWPAELCQVLLHVRLRWRLRSYLDCRSRVTVAQVIGRHGPLDVLKDVDGPSERRHGICPVGHELPILAIQGSIRAELRNGDRKVGVCAGQHRVFGARIHMLSFCRLQAQDAVA
mmetsp:Transcript_57484/g.186737  ORF Transcript_57484/g.186737 Transcript_57484/m.186737 type:complete len:267 (+) Transcript_57484:1647-2447(+)